MVTTSAFLAPSSVTFDARVSSTHDRNRFRPSQPLHVVADAEEIYFKSHRRKSNDDNNNNNKNDNDNHREERNLNSGNNNSDNSPAWIETKSGGFLPNLSSNVFLNQHIQQQKQEQQQRKEQSEQRQQQQQQRRSVSPQATTSFEQKLDFDADQMSRFLFEGSPRTDGFSPRKQVAEQQSSSVIRTPSTDNGKVETTRRMQPATRNKVLEVLSLSDYKRVVTDEREKIVVVRFYASWCRACKAIATHYRQLLPQKFPLVKFVEVPLTKDNAFIHEQLGVKSLPYAHIYYPDKNNNTRDDDDENDSNLLLVEELKIGRSSFGKFVKTLQSYQDEYCTIEYDTNDAIVGSTGSSSSSSNTNDNEIDSTDIDGDI